MLSDNKTKTMAVYRHLKEHGSITSLEAINEYRETRLAAVIHNLIKYGCDIEKVWVEVDDGYRKSRYVRYFFRGDMNARTKES